MTKLNEHQTDSREFANQFEPLTNLSEKEIDLLPKPTGLEELNDNQTGSSSSLDKSNLSTCTKNLYKEILRIVEKGKSLEKLNKKSKDYMHYLDSIKSDNLKEVSLSADNDENANELNGDSKNKRDDQFIVLSDDSSSSCSSRNTSRCSSISYDSYNKTWLPDVDDKFNETENLNESEPSRSTLYTLLFGSLTGLLSAAYYYYNNFY